MKGDITMKINVKNFIEKEIKLPENNKLLPLYEAISNSILANANKISIFVEYFNENKIDGRRNNKIKNIRICDNGEGFTDKNFNSFNSAYDSSKERGKGKGRFFFLKVCKGCHINSVFMENNVFYQREFDFLPDEEGVHSLKDKIPSENNETFTNINLNSIVENFSFDLDEIANLILNTFLLEFRNKKDLQIFLDDNFDKTISLSQKFQELILKDLKFKIKEIDFSMFYLLVEPSQKFNKSKIIFTADQRVVKEIDLENIDKLFANKIDNKILKVYISSKYLDERVNTNRDDFDTNHILFSDINSNITLVDIQVEVINIVRKVLKRFLSKIEEKRKERLKSYLTDSIDLSDRVLYDRFENEILSKLSGNEEHKTIEKVMDDKKRELRKNVQQEMKRIELLDDINREKIREKIDASLQIALTDYIVQRKLIIDLYSKLLKSKKKEGMDNGKFYLEKEIHKLIFPMQKTSDEVLYDEHNLWLIDDSLSFQSYVTSDIELNKIVDSSKSGDRPDLLFFSEYDPDDNLDSVTLIEFKRPEREIGKKEETPHDQVMRYVKQLRSRTLKLNGKVINTSDTTRYYCYILLDLTTKNEEIFIDSSYTPLREHKGYIYYHPAYKMYVTVLDFRALKVDAERRNKIFFEKLGLN